MLIEEAVSDIEIELRNAMRRYHQFNSPHEGYAIILEELDELKTEVFKKQTIRETMKMRKEAMQVAAMALRFMADIC